MYLRCHSLVTDLVESGAFVLSFSEAPSVVIQVGVNAALRHRGLDPLVAHEEASAHVT